MSASTCQAPLIVTIGHRFPNADVEAAAAQPYGVEVRSHGSLAKDDALDAAAHADAVILGLGFDLDEAALSKLKASRVIVRYGIGLDNVDVEAAIARGISVFNVPDYGVEEVANHTLALLLALARRLTVLADRVRTGKWADALAQLGLNRLSTSSLLVVGAGRIGGAVVDRAAAIWGRIDVYDPVAPHAPWIHENTNWVDDLDTALSQADFVTLHAPLTPDTRHLLSRARIASLKPGVIVVNCSRGDLIDETALLDALRTGAIAAAGLDVFATEPEPNPELLALPNVLPTPHSAWYSREAVIDLRQKAARLAARAIRGEEGPHQPKTP